jgi:hypothetical protein
LESLDSLAVLSQGVRTRDGGRVGRWEGKGQRRRLNTECWTDARSGGEKCRESIQLAADSYAVEARCGEEVRACSSLSVVCSAVLPCSAGLWTVDCGYSVPGAALGFTNRDG